VVGRAAAGLVVSPTDQRRHLGAVRRLTDDRDRR
jgi:hypothetical protein